MNITAEEYRMLREYLRAKSGIDITEEKQYLFTTRLSGLLQELHCSTFSELYTLLVSKQDSRLCQRVIQLMTIHESSFFRDGHPFELFSRHLLPSIAEKRARETGLLRPKLSILSAGCSAGQEAYTVAMICKEWVTLQDTYETSDILVSGIDISEQILSRARGGEYCDMEIGTKIPDHFVKRYFSKGSGTWAITDAIKKMVRFEQVNLSEEIATICQFDIILCRNVLIYFSQSVKIKILNQFHRMLKKDGALILGTSESLFGISREFEAKTEYNSVYFVPRL